MLRTVLLCLFLPLAAMAQSLPAPMSDRVNDFADLLPPASEARIEEMLRLGREETGVHVVVVTMERIADFGGAGQRIEDYAKTLFNAWGVGDPVRNDGILILVARQDREMRIALGSGYEVIWDNAAQRVIDRHFLPAFREDRYADGIEAGVPATFDLIARPYLAGLPPPQEAAPRGDIVQVILGVIVALGAVSLIFRRRLGNLIYGFKTCPACGARGLERQQKILRQATTATEGAGEQHIHCRSCGMNRVEPYAIPRISKSSGSSGGFGGGSSSGGGASGRW